MSVVAPTLPTTPWASLTPGPISAPGSCIVLEGVGWATYDMLLRDLGRHPPLRLTYDRGRLQIMSPLPEHERCGGPLALLIQVLAKVSGLPCSGFGSMTIRREDLARGLEPDECFYLTSWPRIRGRRQLDFATDPPPDLAVEIDITRSSLDRFAIYAALGVPEVWRFDGQALTCYHRNDQGTYDERPASRAFPFLRVADLVPFLDQVFDVDDGALMQNFETWLRANLPPSARPATGQIAP